MACGSHCTRAAEKLQAAELSSLDSSSTPRLTLNLKLSACKLQH